MEIQKIITHPGQAHRDDFIACSLVLARFVSPDTESPPEIVRRLPTEQEIQDPTIWLIDVGSRYEPTLNNYDHHQFRKDLGRTCAISLILQNMDGPTEEFYLVAKRALPWLQPTEIRDTSGPRALASHYKCDWDLELVPMASPIEQSILRAFEQNGGARPHTNMWDMMAKIGYDIAETIKAFDKRLRHLHEHGSILDIKGLKFLLCPTWEIDEEGNNISISDPTLAMEAWREDVAPNAAGAVNPDESGEGYALYRYNDHPRVDFSLLERKPGVLFTHKGGFLAKTVERNLQVALALLDDAIID